MNAARAGRAGGSVGRRRGDDGGAGAGVGGRADGRGAGARGWTDLVVTPERGVRVVDGLLTGLHEPEASHLLMLEAVGGAAGRAAARRTRQAVRRRYLWHEFGDVHLLLPRDGPLTQSDCSSNCW